MVGVWRLAVCRFRLARVECAHCLDGVRLRGRFVGTVSFYACESQSESARIVRTGLNIIECNFDDDFRPHRDRVAVRRKLKGFELLACQINISSVMPLKVLPNMTKPPLTGSRAPKCRLLSHPSRRPLPHSMARIRVQSMGPFNFETWPLAPTTAHSVRVQRLRHDAFVTLPERFVQKASAVDSSSQRPAG